MNRPGSPAGAFERALQFCRARRIFTAGDRVLVGSGSGAASLGVLGFLRLAQSELQLADVAVGAVDQGGADDPDAVADTGRFARSLGATFYAVSGDGRSVTRRLQTLARDEGYSCVALGHTRDDAVARVLAQLLGGGGLASLRPFVARRRDGVVRPLLGLRDAEALELARTAGIEPTMLPPEPGGRRSLESRLRESVLPRLRVEVAGTDQSLLELAESAAKHMRAIRRDADAWVASADTRGMRLEVPVVTNPVLAAEVARSILTRLAVTRTVVRAAAASLATLLMARDDAGDYHEVVLGSGLIAAYVPSRRVVAVRVLHGQSTSDEGIG